MTTTNGYGAAGLYFAGSLGNSDDFSVRHLPVVGTCGNGVCEPLFQEDCINCPFGNNGDCVAPCGCGDGVCAGDSEALG
jgi:hypothetical protein